MLVIEWVHYCFCIISAWWTSIIPVAATVANVVQLGLAFVLVNSDEATQRKMVVFVLLIIGGMNKLQSASLEM